jgi:hypothetical protein
MSLKQSIEATYLFRRAQVARHLLGYQTWDQQDEFGADEVKQSSGNGLAFLQTTDEDTAINTDAHTRPQRSRAESGAAVLQLCPE